MVTVCIVSLKDSAVCRTDSQRCQCIVLHQSSITPSERRVVWEVMSMEQKWIGAASRYLSCRRTGLECTRVFAEMLIIPEELLKGRMSVHVPLRSSCVF